MAHTEEPKREHTHEEAPSTPGLGAEAARKGAMADKALDFLA